MGIFLSSWLAEAQSSCHQLLLGPEAERNFWGRKKTKKKKKSYVTQQVEHDRGQTTHPAARYSTHSRAPAVPFAGALRFPLSAESFGMGQKHVNVAQGQLHREGLHSERSLPLPQARMAVGQRLRYS